MYICTCTVGDKIKFHCVPTHHRLVSGVVSKSRPKVASDFRRTLNVIKKVADLFLSGEKLVCTCIQFRPKSRACATEQEAAILLISARYFIVYLHSTVTCRCLLCLLCCLFSSLPVPLGAPVSYFHFRRFFGLVVLRYRMVRDTRWQYLKAR